MDQAVAMMTQLMEDHLMKKRQKYLKAGNIPTCFQSAKRLIKTKQKNILNHNEKHPHGFALNGRGVSNPLNSTGTTCNLQGTRVSLSAQPTEILLSSLSANYITWYMFLYVYLIINLKLRNQDCQAILRNQDCPTILDYILPPKELGVIDDLIYCYLSFFPFSMCWAPFIYCRAKNKKLPLVDSSLSASQHQEAQQDQGSDDATIGSLIR